MFIESLCLSGNNDSKQDRYVETKTQLNKDNLIAFLQRVINNEEKKSDFYFYENWLLGSPLEDRIIDDKDYLDFLIKYLSLDFAPTPNKIGVHLFYILFSRTKPNSYLLLELIIKIHSILPEALLKYWEDLFKHLDKLSIQLDFDFQNVLRKLIVNLSFLLENSNLVSVIRNVNDVTYVKIVKNIMQFEPDDYLKVLKAGNKINKLNIEKEPVNTLTAGSIFTVYDSLYDIINRSEEYFNQIDEKLLFIEKHQDYLSQDLLINFLKRIQSDYTLEILAYVSNQIPYTSNYQGHLIKYLMKNPANYSMHYLEEVKFFINTLFFISDRESWIKNEFKSLFEILTLYINHREYTIAPLEEIENLYIMNHKVEKQQFFSELIAFLFFKYEKPWVLLNEYNSSLYLVLEYLIQANRIISYNKLPLKLSKKESKEFYKLPKDITLSNNNDYSLFHIIGFVKLHAKGIKKEIAIKLLSQIRTEEDLEYWLSNYSFFIKYGDILTTENLEDIFNYVAHHHNFDFKGRTYASVNRILDQWRHDLMIDRYTNGIHNPYATWRKSTYSNFIEIKDDIEYTISELTTGIDLIKESKELNHCVDTYIHKCEIGTSSIWSLRKDANNKIKSLITIEVANRRIVQVKGKYNRIPSSIEKNIIQKWATLNQLVFDQYSWN